MKPPVDIPAPVVYEAIRGRVSQKKYDDFTAKFEMKSAATRESANASRARSDARNSGEFVPSERRKLCNWQNAGMNPICVFHEFTGCSGHSLYHIPGIGCLTCILTEVVAQWSTSWSEFARSRVRFPGRALPTVHSVGTMCRNQCRNQRRNQCSPTCNAPPKESYSVFQS